MAALWLSRAKLQQKNLPTCREGLIFFWGMVLVGLYYLSKKYPVRTTMSCAERLQDTGQSPNCQNQQLKRENDEPLNIYDFSSPGR
jgi:hypothetical protein